MRPGLLLGSLVALCAALWGASRDLVVGLLLGTAVGQLFWSLLVRGVPRRLRRTGPFPGA